MQSVKLSYDFWTEWRMSEVIDNFSAHDVSGITSYLTLTDAEAEVTWNETHGDIFEWDDERIHFTIAMLCAELDADKNTATVVFNDRALAYVRHDLSLDFQINKWISWARDGDKKARGFVREGKAVLAKLAA